jgi:hypothetical protein
MDDNGQMYRRIRFESVPCGDDIVAVISPDRDGAQIMNVDDATALLMCNEPRSCEAHAEAICRFRGGPSKHAASAVQRLVSSGWLRRCDASGGDLCEAEEKDGRAITTVGFVTADRPWQFRRCLTSYVEHLRRHAGNVRVVVVDGSRSDLNKQLNYDAVREIRSQSVDRVHYVGARERVLITNALIDAGAPADAVRVAIPCEIPSDFAAGVGRNLLLLLTCGERILSIDDDTLCAPWVSDNYHDGIELCGHGDATETRFWATRADAVAAVTPAGVSLVEAHDRLLGRSLSSTVAMATDVASWRRACRHMLNAIECCRHAPVRMTMSGIAGDSARYCTETLLFTGGRTRSRMAASRQVFDTAMTSREITSVVTTPTISHDVMCMMYCTGLDNCDVLPPFMPTWRNEDGVFSVTLGAVQSDVFVGHVPVGVIHDAAVHEGRNLGRMLSASTVRIAEVIIGLIRQSGVRPIHSSAAGGLRRLGTHLAEVCNVGGREFIQQVSKLVFEARLARLALVESMGRREFDYPAYWFERLDLYRTALLRGMERRDFITPVELAGEGGDGTLECQQYLRLFGRLLGSWPEVWQVAKDVHGDLARLMDGDC